MTEDRWIACSVLDRINFGLTIGGELKLETTICHLIRQTRKPVVIDHVAEDVFWSNHETPAMYGFKSYISVPILLEDGSFFGTLCAIDPKPARINNEETIEMVRLFGELIAKHLDGHRRLIAAQGALVKERAESELLEHFIAVLGHDLRTPVRGIGCFTDLLLKTPLDERTLGLARVIKDSASRCKG